MTVPHNRNVDIISTFRREQAPALHTARCGHRSLRLYATPYQSGADCVRPKPFTVHLSPFTFHISFFIFHFSYFIIKQPLAQNDVGIVPYVFMQRPTNQVRTASARNRSPFTIPIRCGQSPPTTLHSALCTINYYVIVYYKILTCIIIWLIL